MKVLVIGRGARESAIVNKLYKSSIVDEIFTATGNAYTEKFSENVNIKAEETDKLVEFCKDKQIDVVIINPEIALNLGLSEFLSENGIYAFAPNKEAAKLELSKSFAKSIMKECGVPIPEYQVFKDEKKAFEYIDKSEMPIVIKADGIEGGNGIIIAKDEITAKLAVTVILRDQYFGEAGNKVVIEEFLEGEQIGVIVFADGNNVLVGDEAFIYRRAHDLDRGPHTGGMGSFSPTAVVDKETKKKIEEEIVKPLFKGLAEKGIFYVGPLFLHLIKEKDGNIKVVDINVRFNDPATQVLLPRLKTDFGEILKKAKEKKLNELNLEWENKVAVNVVIVSGGYPVKYETGKKITGIEEVEKMPDVEIYLAAVVKRADGYYTKGGRIVNVVGFGKNLEEARKKAYEAVEKIKFEKMHYRTDIAKATEEEVF